MPRRADAGGELRLPVPNESEDPKGRGATWWIRTATHAGSVDQWQLSRWVESGQGEIAVEPTATVEGEAFTSEGAPAAGLEVVWNRKGLVLRTRVDSDGKFRLTGIPLRGRDPRFPSGTDGESERIGLIEDLAAGKFLAAAVKVRPGTVTSDVRIGNPVSPDDASFVGRITIGGRPLSGVHAGLRGKAHDGRMFTTDADGAFRAPGLKPGPYEVQVYFGDPRVIDDFHADFERPVVLEPGRERRMDLDLPDGAVRLRILDAASDAPVVGAVGYGRPADKNLEATRFEGMRYSVGWGGRVEADGTILLRGLVPGHPHVVAAAAEGYAETEQTGVMPGTGAAPAELTLRIKKKP
jgi:hypothetical protein